MNKIDELIEQLCSDGVQYKKLGEVGIITIGEFVHKNKQNPIGKYPVYNGGTSFTGLYDEFNNTANKIVISARGANAGFVNRVLVDYWAGNSCYSISFKDSSFISWTFVFYYLKHHENKLIGDQQRGGIPAVSKKMVEQFQIPIPPLEVQNEIVKTLDLFTELGVELEAELEARKTQYTFYRDALLNFEGKDVEWKTLGECLEKNMGGGTPSRAKSEYWNGDIPWASVGDLTVDGNFLTTTRNFITVEGLKNSSSNLIKKGSVIAAVKISPGKMKIAKTDVAINQDLRGLYLKDFLNSRFLVYYFQTFSIIGNGTIVKGITVDTLEKNRVPIPPLSEQERIVNILDKFDALVNDISIGLPAEIEARRKQYEYYRNRLLTFNSVSNG